MHSGRLDDAKWHYAYTPKASHPAHEELPHDLIFMPRLPMIDGVPARRRFFFQRNGLAPCTKLVHHLRLLTKQSDLSGRFGMLRPPMTPIGRSAGVTVVAPPRESAWSSLFR